MRIKPTLTVLALLLLVLANAAEIDYDTDASRRMRSYSLIAHCSEEQIMSWQCGLCSDSEQLRSVKFVENKTMSVMLYGGYMQSIDKVVFVWRGTVDVTNWIEDLSYHQVQYRRCSNCKVHEGFYVAYLSVADAFLAAYKQLRAEYPDKEVVMTGASMGAALATIATLEVQTQIESIYELHTWGCPRVGNVELANFQQQRLGRIRRVVHNRDIVPHLPLMSQNYQHPTYEILFNEEMTKYQVCSNGGEDASCSNAYYPNYSVMDHLTYWVKLDPAAICAQP